jgi:hypothetical protein
MVARQQICQDGTAKAATDDCDAKAAIRCLFEPNENSLNRYGSIN